MKTENNYKIEEIIRCLVPGCTYTTDNRQSFNSHIVHNHHIKSKEYYDTYLKKDNDGKCLTCGNPTNFKNMWDGYNKHCSTRCGSLDKDVQEKVRLTSRKKYGTDYPSQSKEVIENIKQSNLKNWGVPWVQQNPEVKAKKDTWWLNNYGDTNPFKTEHFVEISKQTKEKRYGDEYYNNREQAVTTRLNKYGKITFNTWKTRKANIEKFEQDNDCTSITKLIDIYGNGWTSLGLPKIYSNKQNCYIENKYLPQIQKYVEENHFTTCSRAEKEIVNRIKQIYNDEILENSRQIIKPYELDIYLQKLHLAIEYNGIYYHSIQCETPIEYHLEKSLLCREKGIRLIHIYEFENFDEQSMLLLDLINGVDNYPKNDFNKNNLIDNIPEPTVIFDDGRHTIFGAGQLIGGIV